MSKGEKALQKILSGAHDKNVTYEELAAVLIRAGWTLARTKGSHHIFRSPKGQPLTLPKHGKDIKSSYVREARRFLKEEQK